MAKIKLASHLKEDMQRILDGRKDDLTSHIAGQISHAAQELKYDCYIEKMDSEAELKGYTNELLWKIMLELREKGYKVHDEEENNRYYVSWK